MLYICVTRHVDLIVEVWIQCGHKYLEFVTPTVTCGYLLSIVTCAVYLDRCNSSVLITGLPGLLLLLLLLLEEMAETTTYCRLCVRRPLCVICNVLRRDRAPGTIFHGSFMLARKT